MLPLLLSSIAARSLSLYWRRCPDNALRSRTRIDEPDPPKPYLLLEVYVQNSV